MALDSKIGATESVADALARTTGLQRTASDPKGSAWVSANAGTGKTHVLTMRVLRLLLAGTKPERLLCLTYTKAAAAEMSTRVFRRLSQWVTATDEALTAELTALLEHPPTEDEKLLARTLFTRAIETPGGLKVQTIHAFAERLLQRFPIEAGIPPGFSTLDEDLGRTLKREAIATTLRSALRDADAPIGRALRTAVIHASEYSFEDVLNAMLAERRWLAEVDRNALEAAASGANDPYAGLEKALRQSLGVRDGVTEDAIVTEMADIFSDAEITSIEQVLRDGKPTDNKLADKLAGLRGVAAPAARADGLCNALLTKSGTPLKSVMTTDLAAANTGLHDKLTDARDRVHALTTERVSLACVNATCALAALAADVAANYTEAKARRAALDFDDLIDRAVSLLSERDWTLWVLYKLDGGIDHILVDESQDTSPDQWRIVDALSKEFHVGEGMSEIVRTLFAVGDEKQSIYSFQGAAPEMFARMGRVFGERARDGGQSFEDVPLDLSFRTVAPVLQAVDAVFADPSRTPGLTSSQRKVRHAVKRVGEGGLVEVWETEKPEVSISSGAFAPLADTEGVTSPVDRLAARIADTIGRWCETGERLTARGRPIRPGDVLILCRKRRPFAGPMVAALKARGIPVAGADRLHLIEQLAVKDLVALGEFTTLPDDDLTLAALLKSPLIGFDDGDLFAVAHERRGSLWKAMIDGQESSSKVRQAVARLAAWRQRADFLPPFEFFARLLDEDGMRGRLLGRLGTEAADPIDEFLNLAISYDEEEAPSLTGFLNWLVDGDRQIKRDMEQSANEVRVMTVHASKGLEAPIVFLPDTCSTGASGGARDPVTRLGAAPAAGDEEAPRVWTIKGSGKKVEAIETARAAKRAKEAEEMNRLLYVAMTRAEDRLYVCGFQTGLKNNGEVKKLPDDCWYRLVREGLTDVLREAQDDNGRVVWRHETEQTAQLDAPIATEAQEAQRPPPLPDWASRKAPRVGRVALPLTPSQLVPYEADPVGDPLPGPARRPATAIPTEPAATFEADPARTGDPDFRFLRGNLTHALFEHLPGLPEADREQAARGFIDARGTAFTQAERAGIVREVMAVLTDPAFAPLFGPRSRAEVSIAATLPPQSGKGPELNLAGSIDRLAEIDGDLFIVDYKTNRHAAAGPAPGEAGSSEAEEIPEAYLLQLAAYRLALKRIYPDRRIRAGLLWTRQARLVEVAPDRLEAAEARLWTLSQAN